MIPSRKQGGRIGHKEWKKKKRELRKEFRKGTEKKGFIGLIKKNMQKIRINKEGYVKKKGKNTKHGVNKKRRSMREKKRR